MRATPCHPSHAPAHRVLSYARADVVRFLRQHSDYYALLPIERGLHDAFRSVDDATARYCFFNCYNMPP